MSERTDPSAFEPRLADLLRGCPPEPGLLARDEPPPFAFCNLGGAAPLILTCDHASNRLPRALGQLGLERAELARHIAWDIGAAEVTRRLAPLLDAPAVLSGFSRLIIDPNRRFGVANSVPEESDGTAVPANRDLDAAALALRRNGLFMPYHGAVARLIEAVLASGRTPALLFMHSFTPVMEGFERPWEIGVLWDRDPRLAVPLIRGLRARGLTVGDNEPYSGASPVDYSLHAHAEARRLPAALIEIRQDLIDTAAGAERWAQLLAEVVGPLLEDPAVFREAQLAGRPAGGGRP
ncbi:Predicted N-formylglutamate amidohydrolase [Tistlia consotensis]|uniref:Predicted N-formylglutamate amidohydrolase n=1 Tax=Tistlia consotensis USBA 355 TaxID=560819 RepID=A0A1Y6CB98_9PROT|nr:N-formylglutamate amidohydrolase [Tistlia consotensis]SMF45864.1 Predicted N-formylglutamate amidohydrolase [Tistlia consotensis USBA 355]SNR79141.1 Predicted N-formylglutamate amidohydrolase [Tistlia consotensis]